MNLSESYKIIKRSIVAIVPKYIKKQKKDDIRPFFPPIFGTGFVIKENGIIVTNDHVVKVVPNLYKPQNAPEEEWPLIAILFKPSTKGLIEITLEVLGVFTISKYIPGNRYYGPKKPDIAFIHVKAKGLPSLDIDNTIFIEEGMEIATAGYPMGTDSLMAPGWLHQITPTLQKGIISAVLPFSSPLSTPHGFSINIMTQGGASGSPVFLPESGKVIGVLYAGLNDIDHTYLENKEILYNKPTNISYVIPSHLINESLKSVENNKNFKLPDDALSIDEMIESRKLVDVFDNSKKYNGKELKPIENKKIDK